MNVVQRVTVPRVELYPGIAADMLFTQAKTLGQRPVYVVQLRAASADALDLPACMYLNVDSEGRYRARVGRRAVQQKPRESLRAFFSRAVDVLWSSALYYGI